MSMSDKCIAFRIDNLLREEKLAHPESLFKFKDRRENDIEDLRGNARVELCSRELWLKFYELGTEMIITKAGRRMFPTVQVRVSGLQESKFYNVFLELMPIDNRRHRFNHIKGRWEACVDDNVTSAERHSGMMIHPTSPSFGKNWESHGLLSFDRIKLTNRRRPLMKDHISLASMHKYMVQIHVMLSDPMSGGLNEILDLNRAMSFEFPETTFIAVTAYQNHKMTKLKCACNSFATGYRSIKNNPLATNQITLSLKHSPPRRDDNGSEKIPRSVGIIYTDGVINGDVEYSEKSKTNNFPGTRLKNSLTRISANKSNSAPETNNRAHRLVQQKTNFIIRNPIKFVIPPLNKNIMAAHLKPVHRGDI